MGSPLYKLNQDDLTKIGKVLLYSGGSAIIGSLIAILPQIDFPLEWIWLVPVVNAVLVAIKKLLSNSDNQFMGEEI